MERDTNIAFIPKAPLTTGVSSSRPTSILFVVAVLIFLVSVGVSGGLFIYKRVLGNKLAEQEQTVAQLRAEYEANAERENVIRRAEELGIQVGAVEKLLKDHLVLTPVFDFLEAHTLKDVQFTSFGFLEDPETKELTVTLEATANSYMTAALQREELKRYAKGGAAYDADGGSVLSSFTISTPTLTEEGAISFTLELLLNREALRYERTILPVSAATPTLEVTETQTTN